MVLGASLASLLVVFAAQVGCGGSAEAGVPTRAEVISCIKAGGGRPWGMAPTYPGGIHGRYEKAYALGPDGGHIGILLAEEPTFTHFVVQGFDTIHEYEALPAVDGHALILLDTVPTKGDRRLAFKCLGA
jgi:hypothetical protein